MHPVDTSLKGLAPTVVIFLIIVPAAASAIVVNCSEPNQPALLKALAPVFNLSAIRPVENTSTCTNVSSYFTLYGILGVDEKAQLLITYLWMNYRWHNEFVSWDPEQCGTNKISLPRNKFWVPDIVINEFMDEDTAPQVPYVYLHNDGLVHDAKPFRVVSSCNLDIYTFPFDIQDCTLTFNSYLHHSNDIKIILTRPAEQITETSKKLMTTMGEWELLDITSHKDTIPSSDGQRIDELIFHIRVRRRATLYVVNLLIPSCFLITVDLFSFLLPPQTVDRSSFKMTLILGYTVFLLIMNDLLPITGNTIPLINVFFSLCLALMVASLLETIFITNLLSGSNDFSPAPRWIRVFVLQFLGYLVCLPFKPKQTKCSDLKLSTVAAPEIASEKPSEKMEPAAVADSGAVEELRSLGRDLQAIRLRVEEQLSGSQSSEEWTQRWLLHVKPSKLLFISIFVLVHAPCGSVMLNCSRPDNPALLEVLRPVFNLSSIRPVQNYSTTTHVTIDIILFGILGVDEKAQLVSLFIWQYLEWKNEFVGWDPEQCGTSLISVPRKLLWVPDIVINEFMEENSLPTAPYSYLYSDGLVRDKQPVKVVSSCRLNMHAFPFDIQNCTLTFNSYLLRSTALRLHLKLSVEEMLKYSKKVITSMGEWELIGLAAKNFLQPASHGELYEELRFAVSFRRQPILYVLNLLIPSCFLITLDLFSFLLPAKSTTRSYFKITLILGYTVFLLNMSDLLPGAGNSIPLINVFLSLCLALMMLSLLETILITNLCHSARDSPVPRWIRVFVLHILGCLVGPHPKPRDVVRTEDKHPVAQAEIKVSTLEGWKLYSNAPQQTGPLDDEKTLLELKILAQVLRGLHLRVKASQHSEEWIQVGLIIDRLLFGLYVLFLLVSFSTIAFFWVTSYKTT